MDGISRFSNGYRILVSIVLGFLFVVTLTGNSDFRRRAHQITDVSNVTSDDIKVEIEFGRSIAARILGRLKLSPDRKLNKYVALTGQALARNSARSELQFHFAVLESDAVNAFSAPGGYVFVTRGAIELMHDESELAAVLAHEIAHITERHIVKELNIKAADLSATSGVAKILGGGGSSLQVAFFQTVDKAVEMLFQRGFKMQDEIAADTVGTTLLAQTGYNPAALISYMLRVDAHLKSVKDQTYVTHPPTRERMDALSNYLRKNDLTTVAFPRMKKRFQQNVKP